MARDHLQFVTGRLAQHALGEIVPPLARDRNFDFSIDVLPITVAALMTPDWIARHIQRIAGVNRVLVPGYCQGDLAPIATATGANVERGPRDLRELPAFFGRVPPPTNYGDYSIEIIAEINHCPRRTLADIRATARQLATDGADAIDLGCEPGGPWRGIAEAVRALRDDGHRVSVDSTDSREIGPATRAGAELVLSVNSSNRDAAPDWGCEVVVIPDEPHTLAGLDDSINTLAAHGVRLRIDPVLEPIGFGFAQSLHRYLLVRERYPDAEIMMGIGNLTELTDADSAPINTLLLGFSQELGIRSVLTTQVTNWARSSVRECDLARRLVHYAHQHRVLPKHVEPRLILLRDPAPCEPSPDDLDRLATEIKDSNYRIFTAQGETHLVSHHLHLHDADPFLLFDRLRQTGPQGSPPKNLNPAHAFYLGYELCKAATAIALGKQYQQDEPLTWGYLTQPKQHNERLQHHNKPET